MINMSNTKAQLFEHIRALDAENTSLAGQLQCCRADLAMAQSAPVLPRGKAIHLSYYDYVRACRVAQRGQGVCTYKSFAQWNAAPVPFEPALV